MRNFSIVSGVALFLSIGLFPFAQGQQVEREIAISDRAQFSLENTTTKLRIAEKKLTVLVEIITAKKIESDPLPEQPKFSGLAVKQIAITINNRNVIVPKSATDYLFDVNRCFIRRDRNGWALSIDGRDGAYGYMAVIYFDHSRVLRRAMFTGADQSRLTEEIRYMPPDIIN